MRNPHAMGLFVVGAWMTAVACVGDSQGVPDGGPDGTANDTGTPDTVQGDNNTPDAGPTMYGRFAYAANGADGTITAYAIDGASGYLRIGTYAYTGKGARLAIDATGKYLYATGTSTGPNITLFPIGADGSLPFAGTVTTLGGSPTSLALEPTGHYAYVVAGSNIHQFSIGGGGALTPLSVPTIATGAATLAHAIAIDGMGKHLYVASDGGLVYEYDIGGNGQLAPNASSTIPAGTGLQSITIDPAGTHAYVTSIADNAVYQYSISSTGALAHLSATKVSTGGQPVSVTIHPSGKYAYVANRADSNISQYDIDTGGALTPMSAPTAATGASPLAVTFDASGRFAYTENATDDTIAQLTVGANGALTLTRTVRTRDNPTAFAMTSGLTPLSYKVEFAYAASYYASDAGANVSQYSVGSTGALTGVGVAAGTGYAARYVAANPAGSYVYVSNLLGASIAQYSVGSTGTLTALNPTYALTGTGPIGIAIDPNGRFVYDVNYYSNNISAFSVSAGKLTAIGSPLATGSSPICAALDPTGRFIYVSNSDSSATNAPGPNTSLSTYALNDITTGLLTAGATTNLANDKIWCANVDPTGQYVYAISNDTTGTIYQYKIDTTGALLALVPATLSTGAGASVLTFDPYGRFMYVANGVGNSVSQYAIGAGGVLQPLSPPTVNAGKGPTGITVDIAGQHAYVTNGGDNTISQYAIGANGTLTQLTPATIDDFAGTYPSSITTTGVIQ